MCILVLRDEEKSKRAPAMRETTNITRSTLRRIAITMILGLLSLSTLVYAESGKINLIFADGQVTNNNNVAFYEFDVKGYISDGSDVVGEGMVYIQYPSNIFGDCIVYNQKVSVVKNGILSGTDPFINSELYRLVNITDTYSDVFAITFASTFDQIELKPYYSSMSTDQNNPSDLLHVSIEIGESYSGEILFPAYIPGINSLFFDYENSVFNGGLDISKTLLTVSFGNSNDPGNTDPNTEPDIEPDIEPVFAGSVDLQNFTTRIKRSLVELNWRTTQEIDLYAYQVDRSSNGGSYEELAVVPVGSAKGKFNTYKLDDMSLSPGTNYTYQLSAIDVNGNKELLASKTVYLDAGKKTILDDGSFALEASYPNPFNPSFTVPFSVSSSQNVNILLYDLSGKLIQTVADGYYSPGNYKIRVSCDDLVSGVYLLKVRTNDQQAIQKMLLTK